MSGRKEDDKEINNSITCSAKLSNGIISCNPERRRGAFVPFTMTRLRATNISPPDHDHGDLSSSTNIKIGRDIKYVRREEDTLQIDGRTNTISPNNVINHDNDPSLTTNINIKIKSIQCNNVNQLNKKQRRRWSPELHRRFVNALHQLGGSQCTCKISSLIIYIMFIFSHCWMFKDNRIYCFVAIVVATPKQIRALLKVDNLTNDEVKSHLQVLQYYLEICCMHVCGEFGMYYPKFGLLKFMFLDGDHIYQN